MTQPAFPPARTPSTRPRCRRRWGLALAALALIPGLGACTGMGAGPAGTPTVPATPAEAYPPPGAPPTPGQAPDAPYPPPRTPVSAAPTSAVEADGYRALPGAVDSNVVTLDKAPHTEFLRKLQDQLDAGDATGLAAYVSDDRGRLSAAPIQYLESSRGYGMDSREAEAVLRALFDAGSRPRIEGLHVESTSPTANCLAIVTSGWRAATYVRPTPTGPAPAATSEMGPEPTEVVVAGGEHRWDMCSTKHGWTQWEGWWWGGYGDLIARMTDVGEEHPYLAVRPVGATRTVTMTQGGAPFALDIPAGWLFEAAGPDVYGLQSFNRLVGKGGIAGDLTKIEIIPESGSLDELEAGYRQPKEGGKVVKLERTTVGADGHPALVAVVEGELGTVTVVTVNLGENGYRLQCYGDCTGLLPIAATIRPTGATP
jgi:hypothetical protein